MPIDAVLVDVTREVELFDVRTIEAQMPPTADRG